MKSESKYKQYNTWEVINEEQAIKRGDKSCFDWKGSGIPKGMRWFFELENIEHGNNIEISIMYKGITHSGYFTLDPQGRTRIFWRKSLDEVLNTYNESCNTYPFLAFKKINKVTYELDLLNGDISNIDMKDAKKKSEKKRRIIEYGKGLTIREAPKNRIVGNKEGKKDTDDFIGSDVNFEQEAKKNSKLGKLGEDAVVLFERKRLIEEGHPELAEKVVTTRKIIGNNAKYDVHSYNKDGSNRYIEVKTTKGSVNSHINISEREVQFSESYSKSYYLYRIYNFNESTMEGEFYILQGAISRKKLVPKTYIM